MRSKFIYIFTMCALVSTVFTACGEADSSKVATDQNEETKTEDKAVEQNSSKEKDVVVATGQAGDYLIQVVLKNGSRIQDELSPDKNNFEGTFDIKVSKDGEERGNLELTYDNSEEGIVLPEGETIQMCDYNGDGQQDFAIGQSLSSSAKDYQFYTITKNGMVEQLKGNIVADEGYFPMFEMKEGKIQYRQYNQDTGKYVDKTVQIGK